MNGQQTELLASLDLGGEHRAGEKIKNLGLFSRTDYVVYFLLTGLSLASVIDFGRHWFSKNDWSIFPVTLSILTGVISLKLLEHYARSLMLPMMSKPLPKAASPGLKVAVVTTFVPSGEPLAMLEQTLHALINLSYAHDTWVLDEEDDEHVKELCAQLGANHFSRKQLAQYQSPAGTFRSHSKHGNYNAWLHEIGFERYDFIVAFDPDHIPLPAFLDRVLGYFDDPRVGYVQAPAAYYNQRASFIARGAAEETYSYYSCTQMAAHTLGHPFVNGCHNSHRVSALKQVGGFAAHNADDLLITLLYRDCGWRGVYVPEILAWGLVPVDWNGYLGQQTRWARSILDVKLRRYQRLDRTLSLPERLTAFFDGLIYLQSSLTMAALIVILNVTLSTGVATDFMSATTVIKFVTMCAMLQLAAFYRQRFFLEPRVEWGLHWRSRVLRYAKWPFVLMALWSVIFGREPGYTLTQKSKPAPSSWSWLWPHAFTILLTIAALLVGVVSGRKLAPVWYVGAAVLIAGTSLLLLTQLMRFPPPYEDSKARELAENHVR